NDQNFLFPVRAGEYCPWRRDSIAPAEYCSDTHRNRRRIQCNQTNYALAVFQYLPLAHTRTIVAVASWPGRRRHKVRNGYRLAPVREPVVLFVWERGCNWWS